MSSKWYWDDETFRYRYIRNNRLVPQKYVKNDIFRLSFGVRADMRELTRMLNANEITPDEWFKRMQVEMRVSYRAAIVAAEGGLGNMTPAKWGRFGAIMKKEYAYLRNFLKAIKNGSWTGARALVRAGWYGNSIARIYENWRFTQHKTAGFTEARRKLGVAEHCNSSKGLEGCVELAARGWVWVDDMTEIGDTPCRSNCHCSIEYRNRFMM